MGFIYEGVKRHRSTTVVAQSMDVMGTKKKKKERKKERKKEKKNPTKHPPPPNPRWYM